MPAGAPIPIRRRVLRVRGRRLLLVFGLLALLCGAALYAALFPLYLRGKEGLRTAPDSRHQPTP